ncbi:MAG: cysteine desulfurase NifS [Oscillospiraceae bacterium]|nr:cysteine desulfurase NifS [Oscillospiraceae bacterium]MCI9563632.1 cysteine desulfurase NifS [Oscillospiraceae bacterium]
MFVYADNAATTAMSKAAIDAMTPAMHQLYGNPSSLHQKGREANYALMDARETVARCLNAQPREIYFTGCGTESDNWAITEGARLGAEQGKRHIISDPIEHHAVLHTLAKLEKQGFEVTYLPVHEDGVVRLEDLAAAIRPDTCLVTIMFSNNEIGTVQPIREIGALCRERGVLFHTDAVQAVGHLPIDVAADNIDMLSLSGHKFHAPKGVGALYCKKSVPIRNFIEGGAQERGRRGGTEAIPAILAMAAAMKDSCEHMEENMARVSAMRDKLIDGLSKIPRSRCNGSPDHRAPGLVSFCFEGIEGESLLLRLDLAGICASSGSACTSGSLDPSHVLLALGMPHEIAHGSLRLSLSEYNTMEEVDYILQQVPEVVRTLRQMSPVWSRMLETMEDPYQ